jgi:hypothetical protein
VGSTRGGWGEALPEVEVKGVQGMDDGVMRWLVSFFADVKGPRALVRQQVVGYVVKDMSTELFRQLLAMMDV